MASTILATLLIPVVTGFNSSSKQLRTEQLENAAANFAQKVFEQRVFGRQFENITTELDVVVPPGGRQPPVAPGEPSVVLDGITGVWFRYSLEVRDVAATELVNPSIPSVAPIPAFNYVRITTMTCDAGGAHGAGNYTYVPADMDQTDPLYVIDSKWNDVVVMKDILLLLEWRGPGDDPFQAGVPVSDPARRAVLLTRRVKGE